jgi:hypothetical protein
LQPLQQMGRKAAGPNSAALQGVEMGATFSCPFVSTTAVHHILWSLAPLHRAITEKEWKGLIDLLSRFPCQPTVKS